MTTPPSPAAPAAGPASAAGPIGDVRRVGFADRAPVERAQAWLDALPFAGRRATEEVAVAACAGRVPAAPVAAPGPLPQVACATVDGWAVRAVETLGGSDYDPVRLRLGAAGALQPGEARPLVAGDALPDGADAILPYEAAQAAEAALEVSAAAAPGSGVAAPGQHLAAGAPLAAAPRALRPHEAALLAAAGVVALRAWAPPRVRLLLAGPKGGAPEAHAAMLGALLVRDGAAVEVLAAGDDDRALRDAATAPGADLLLATGRTGTGPDDGWPQALARAGHLAFHGLALRPGGSCALGLVGGLPVVLLPGDPLACLCAYELLAGRLVRRLAGRDAALPHARLEAGVGRKLVSAIGFLDVCQVRLVAGNVEPLGVAEAGGLAAAARADGFVLIPPALEGYAPGARVTVHCH